MTQAIAKYAARKMFASELEKYKSKPVDDIYDPYYEMIPNPRKPGQQKKVKKQIPAWIPEHDANILARARKSAYRLDFCLFNFLGFRFGWSSVIGLVPVAGDAADTLVAVKLIRSMNKCDGNLSKDILLRMMLNVILDLVIGLVPFVGDLADAYYKANSKNVRLFEEYLDKKYRPEPRGTQQGRKARPATVYEDFSDEEETRNSMLDEHRDEVRRPQPAHSSRRDRIVDEEMGVAREETHRTQRSDRSSPQDTRKSRRR